MRHTAATVRRSRLDLGPAPGFIEYSGVGAGPAVDGKMHTVAYAPPKYGPGSFCHERRRRAQALKLAEFDFERNE